MEDHKSFRSMTGSCFQQQIGHRNKNRCIHYASSLLPRKGKTLICNAENANQRELSGVQFAKHVNHKWGFAALNAFANITLGKEYLHHLLKLTIRKAFKMLHQKLHNLIKMSQAHRQNHNLRQHHKLIKSLHYLFKKLLHLLLLHHHSMIITHLYHHSHLPKGVVNLLLSPQHL